MDLGRYVAHAGSSRSRKRACRRPECQELHEEGASDIVRRRLRALLHSGRSDPRPAWVVARRPTRCGANRIGGHQRSRHRCRRAAERKPRSRARIGRSSGVPTRRKRLQKSASDVTGPEKRASRWQRDAWTGARPAQAHEKARAGATASISGVAAAKPRRRPRSEPGAREGVAGRRSLPDGRHSGSSFRSASIHASTPCGGLGPSREGRQGCQRLGRPLARALRRSESLCREAGESPAKRA